jgi:vanillate O-demethylase monooxygenase subunit
MFLKSCWYVAGWTRDLPANQLLACTIADDSIVVYRKHDGSVVALEDRCCHRFAPLSDPGIRVPGGAQRVSRART